MLDEARITASLQHPNIAQVYEVGLSEGQHFIAMEFIEGPTLRTIISNHHRSGQIVPLPMSLAIAKGLLAALEHAHALTDGSGRSLQVVHRDVTPANVLLSLRGEPKLVDFGLVMAANRLFKTDTGLARGTLPYMSPEQSTHAPLDARADLYSAGATLFELMTGVRPFPNGPTGARPPRASVMNSALPPAIDEVFERALKGAFEERFDSALMMWRALRDAAADTEEASVAALGHWAKLNEKPIAAAQAEGEGEGEGTESIGRGAMPTRSD